MRSQVRLFTFSVKMAASDVEQLQVVELLALFYYFCFIFHSPTSPLRHFRLLVLPSVARYPPLNQCPSG